jgi:hypothetical protein
MKRAVVQGSRLVVRQAVVVVDEQYWMVDV